MGKSFFPHPKMLIYAINPKTTWPISFFLNQKKRNYYLGNYKNYQSEVLQR